MPSSPTQPNHRTPIYLVIGGTVVSMDAAHTLIEDGALAITGDTIQAVGKRSEHRSALFRSGKQARR